MDTSTPHPVAVSDEAAPRTAPGVMIAESLALLLAVIVVLLTAHIDRWSPVPLAVIAGFAVVAQLTAGQSESNMTVYGSFLGVILADVMLGGGPAAAIGGLTIAVGWLRARWPIALLLNNLVNFTWAPLVGGLFFHFGIRAAGAGPRDIAYYLLVFVTYLVALAINFSVCAGDQCLRERSNFVTKARETLVPTLSAELMCALLIVAVALIVFKLGTIGLVMFGVVLLVFQYLAGQLLTSKRRSEQLQRIATTDELTGLANRERFREAVEQRIADVGAGGPFCVLLMDLDRFKEVNDTLGHLYGDILLRDLGPRLVRAVGEHGLVARLGGDEFAILPGPDTDDPAALDRVITRLGASVNHPFVVDELSLEVGSSIGVSRYPQDGRDSHALLRCADIAMYAAKEAQTDFKMYTAEQDQHSVRRLRVLSDMRRALVGDQIVVHYQPIVDLDDRTVKGAEGLVRWEHPEHGLMPPGAFVQTVEQTGLIGPLTRLVLNRSIAECASWRRDGRELSVAVNLSVRNLLDRDLPQEIERILDTHGVPAHALQLEITESMIMTDPDRALATVSRLSALGVRLSVDDFGTGYSSLANLRRLPINELKIDRSFVSPMLRDESDLIIVRSTINLGHDLGLRIIAEGVEDAPTLEQLSEMGCDLAQGYHLSRPMPGSVFSTWLDESPHGHASSSARAGQAVPADAIGPARTIPSGNLVMARAED